MSPASALALLRPLADRGDPEAQKDLGLIFDNGDGVPRDGAQAVLWYRKAAGQDNVEAQGKLGLIYFGGLDGVLETLNKALP